MCIHAHRVGVGAVEEAEVPAGGARRCVPACHDLHGGGVGADDGAAEQGGVGAAAFEGDGEGGLAVGGAGFRGGKTAGAECAELHAGDAGDVVALADEDLKARVAKFAPEAGVIAGGGRRSAGGIDDERGQQRDLAVVIDGGDDGQDDPIRDWLNPWTPPGMILQLNHAPLLAGGNGGSIWFLNWPLLPRWWGGGSGCGGLPGKAAI